MQNVNILQIKKKVTSWKYTTFCRGIHWDCAASLKKYNEIYLLIKYIKSFLWRVAEHLSYIQDAWCINVNAQHVSDVNTSILRSLRLIVDLFHVLYCSGTMRVGVTVWFGWGGVVSLLFHYLLLNMFRMLVHLSSGACDLLWIYFMCCIALVRCVLVLRCGSPGVVWYPYYFTIYCSTCFEY